MNFKSFINEELTDADKKDIEAGELLYKELKDNPEFRVMGSFAGYKARLRKYLKLTPMTTLIGNDLTKSQLYAGKRLAGLSKNDATKQIFGAYLKESMTFDEKMTGMSKYDDVLSKPDYKTSVGWKDGKTIKGNYWREYKHWDWKIVHISPDTYIKACAKGFNMSITDSLIGRDDLKRIKELVDKGTKIHMPVLEYGEYFSQEGLHRALYAKEIGIKSIPVLVFITDTRVKKLDAVLKSIGA